MPLQVSLECLRGELHALVGPSGSGKTSVLRTIAGLRNPSTGRIECDDEIWFESDELRGVRTALSPAKRSCGFLFQQYALFPHLTALENVCIPLKNSGLKTSQLKLIALKWLEHMGIAELALRMPTQLSGGQQQREIEKTASKLAKEKQFNRKVEINADLRKLKTELDGLTQ